jgi:hypothetical protein
MLSLAIARDMLSRFPIDTKDWRLLGLGLHRCRIKSFVGEFQPRKKNQWTHGLYDAITLNRELEPTGQFIGYDVLGVDGGSTIHSWLCNGLDTRAHSFGIHSNSQGLLETLADAEKIAADASDPATGAEPVPWFPFAIVQYVI